MLLPFAGGSSDETGSDLDEVPEIGAARERRLMAGQSQRLRRYVEEMSSRGPSQLRYLERMAVKKRVRI